MLNDHLRVLMVAAECRDLVKVGGLADVVRDLSKILKAVGVPVSVVMPCYDAVEDRGESTHRFDITFAGRTWVVEVFRRVLDGVDVYLLRNDDFLGGNYGDVYIDSARFGRGPFEDDAKRFAFFSTAVLGFLDRFSGVQETNVLHCHDWHTGVLLTLLNHDPRYSELAGRLRTLFTIHNLDYQGTRPFELQESRTLVSFSEWFPAFYVQFYEKLQAHNDPRAEDCFNPMRAGINLADHVNVVSPTYAREVTQPDDEDRNFFGGRGLERDLQRRESEGRLHGILNGIDNDVWDPAKIADPPFDAPGDARSQSKANLLRRLPVHLDKVYANLKEREREDPSVERNVENVLERMQTYDADAWLRRPLVVAVTRAAGQKVKILLETLDGTVTVLQSILNRNLSLIVLGTGEYQDELEEINARPNGLFVCAYANDLANRMYAGGDLFLMPSDFEPCGLSQMIAMRFGCLPLAYDIGGLHDTVRDMQTGFVYSGDTRDEARQALLDTLDRALDCLANNPSHWTQMQRQAMAERFEWMAAAKKYIQLYAGEIS